MLYPPCGRMLAQRMTLQLGSTKEKKGNEPLQRVVEEVRLRSLDLNMEKWEQQTSLVAIP